ncbi:MAG: sigma-E processing peptidase SpoIIGA, partial [Dorea sp.]
LREISLFCVIAIAGYHVVLGMWDILAYLARQKAVRCEVKLCKGSQKVQVKAMIDTGNSLRDKVTGKAVNIITSSVARELGWGEQTQQIRYISYCSIGKKDGVMPLMVLDSMYVNTEPGKNIEKPLVAICDEEISTDGYKMILNPDVLL